VPVGAQLAWPEQPRIGRQPRSEIEPPLQAPPPDSLPAGQGSYWMGLQTAFAPASKPSMVKPDAFKKRRSWEAAGGRRCRSGWMNGRPHLRAGRRQFLRGGGGPAASGESSTSVRGRRAALGSATGHLDVFTPRNR